MSQRQIEVMERLWRCGRDEDSPPPDGALHDLSLAKVVISARLDRGLIQRDLAHLAGVSQSMVSRLERGSREPRWRTFRMLLEAMNLEPVVEARPRQTSDDGAVVVRTVVAGGTLPHVVDE